jgi:hypothetical protein
MEAQEEIIKLNSFSILLPCNETKHHQNNIKEDQDNDDDDDDDDDIFKTISEKNTISTYELAALISKFF